MANPQPRTTFTAVRNVDPAVWHQIVSEARRHDLTAGALLTLIAQEWLADHQCQSRIEPLTQRAPA